MILASACSRNRFLKVCSVLYSIHSWAGLHDQHCQNRASKVKSGYHLMMNCTHDGFTFDEVSEIVVNPGNVLHGEYHVDERMFFVHHNI